MRRRATTARCCSDIDVDVAIIGSGATGMATALYLAREHGIRATVLEANQAAWGCSSRSGGQGQNASGRLKRSQWIERWGLDVARRLDAEIRAGFENFRMLTPEIDCDAHDGGHLYVAHRPREDGHAAQRGALMRETFGYATRILSADELRRDYCDEREAAGAMLEPDGIGIHPLKFTYGLIAPGPCARRRACTPASPVQGWHDAGGVHHLRTPGGTVRAQRVAVCTGGYTGQRLHPQLQNRLMPILSNSVVTRPLTEAELKATNFRSQIFMTDTRTLRFYYRLLPDNRLQIGSRSAMTGADAAGPGAPEAAHRRASRASSRRCAGIGIDYSWWGWVDVSHDMMPRITQPDPAQKVWYALGYGGNGVSFSTRAGKRLAERIAGSDAGRDSSSCRSTTRRCSIRTCSGRALAGVRAVPPPRPARALPLVRAAG